MNPKLRLIAVCVAASLSLCASLALAGGAYASFHLDRIVQVHADGDGLGPDNTYVELQMPADGENFVKDHYIQTYDNGGGVFSTFQFPAKASVGKSQRTILIASGPSVNGVAADFNAGSDLNVVTNASGAVCYISVLPASGLDCVAFAFPGYTIVGGAPSPFGTPALDLNGLAPGETLVRSIGRGCSTLFEVGDDTDDSAADFALGAESPRNNAATPTERACAKCAGKKATIVGTNGRDTLTGTAAVDVIAGLSGNDTLKGLGGKDVICGGGGKDKLVGGGGKDKLFGQAGKDTLRGGPGKDKLVGGPGKDVQVQ